MIYGQKGISDDPKEILVKLPQTFFLTGSRFFGTATETSDWDYFVQNSESVHRDLLANGFTLECESYARDPMFTSVYKLKDVHVQVCVNALIKMQVQRRLYGIFAMFKPTKEQAKYLWSRAMDCYRDGLVGAHHFKFTSF